MYDYNKCVRAACVRSGGLACVSLCYIIMCVRGEAARGLARDVLVGVMRR